MISKIFNMFFLQTPSTPARRSLFAPKPRDDLVSCKMCGRNFAEDRIEKHEEICSKTAAKAKKRKVFDMTKARVKGTDAAKYVKSAAQLKNIEAKVNYFWVIGANIFVTGGGEKISNNYLSFLVIPVACK